MGIRHRKIPPFGGTFLLSLGSPSSWRSTNDPLTILGRILALTARILLLLSWLLATALLLARLLSGILVLLAGILVLIGHRDLLF
jgi:hypothetical protein